MIRIFHQDQVKAVVMGGACGMQRKVKKLLEGFSGKVDGKRPLGISRHRGNNSHIHYYGKDCLRHHSLLNYRQDLFNIDIFRKLMVGIVGNLLCFY